MTQVITGDTVINQDIIGALDINQDFIGDYQGTIKVKIWSSICAEFGILLSKMFWTTVRKKYSYDLEKLLKFKAEGWEFSKFLRLLEQFIQTVKGQNNFW